MTDAIENPPEKELEDVMEPDTLICPVCHHAMGALANSDRVILHVIRCYAAEIINLKEKIQ